MMTPLGESPMITLSASDTALIVVDLQNAVMAQSVEPRPSSAVLDNCKALADRFRAAGAPVILLNVAFAPDFADALKTPADRASPAAKGPLIENWASLAEGLAEPADIRITKRQWGGFYGTDLDLQLRRRGIRTVVIGGAFGARTWLCADPGGGCLRQPDRRHACLRLYADLPLSGPRRQHQSHRFRTIAAML
jgi:isochorismate hydrolase